jgi:NAD(P)-dependent dehydrogenase (short-subunit alcohol dehydrogenase family)
MDTISLVVGGTRGIGSVITDSLNKRGDNVFTISRKDNSYKNHIQCDISKTCENITSVVDKVDNLIFSHRYRGNDWEKTFDVTVRGIHNMIAEILPFFSKNASVVIISSNASKFFINGQSAEYHSSRAALEGLMRYYAAVYGKKGIRFNNILPSTLIKPENVDFFTKDNSVRKMIEEITPLGRMGEASDVANIVNFLCSSKASFVTGNSFMVDGGLSLVGQESIARELLSLQY